MIKINEKLVIWRIFLIKYFKKKKNFGNNLFGNNFMKKRHFSDDEEKLIIAIIERILSKLFLKRGMF